MSDNDLLSNSSKSSVTWKHYIAHGGYFLYTVAFSFFSKPFKKEKKDINLLDQVKLLIDTDPINSDIIDKCEQYIGLHCIVENTKARRRLEKWASRIIAIYLFVVLGIVVCNYASIEPFNKWGTMSISDPVMITILSTTTVNIIGLGLIVLRGHFLMNDLKHDKGKTKSKEPYK